MKMTKSNFSSKQRLKKIRFCIRYFFFKNCQEKAIERIDLTLKYHVEKSFTLRYSNSKIGSKNGFGVGIFLYVTRVKAQILLEVQS